MKSDTIKALIPAVLVVVVLFLELWLWMDIPLPMVCYMLVSSALGALLLGTYR